MNSELRTFSGERRENLGCRPRPAHGISAESAEMRHELAVDCQLSRSTFVDGAFEPRNCTGEVGLRGARTASHALGGGFECLDHLCVKEGFGRPEGIRYRVLA